MTVLDNAINKMLKVHEEKTLVVVAIDGCSGSGKSTLASELVKKFGDCTIIHADDFYHPMEFAEMAQLGPRDGFYRYFDWQRLKGQVLEPLLAGHRINFKTYDWGSNEVGPLEIKVEPHGIVIVEGVYSLFDRLRDFYDVSIFVETSAQERRRRCFDRKGDEFAAGRDRASAYHPPEFWINLWMDAEDWYLANFKPNEWADFIIPGGSSG